MLYRGSTSCASFGNTREIVCVSKDREMPKGEAPLRSLCIHVWRASRRSSHVARECYWLYSMNEKHALIGFRSMQFHEGDKSYEVQKFH